MNLLAAVGTSVVLGLVGTRYSHYAYWRSWGTGAFVVGVLALLAVYGVFGVIGYGVLGAVGGGGEGAAAVHGGFGYALLRVQVGRLGPGDEGGEAAPRNALSLIREWLFEFLEHRAHVGVVGWTNRRTDEQLSETALNLFHRTFDETTQLGRKMLREVREATRNLRSPDVDVAADSRGRLRGSIIQQIESGRLTRDEL